MERQQLDGVGRAYLENRGDPSVQLAPTSVRKAFVCAVADERVAEAEGARDVGITLDELGKSVPCLRVGGCGRVSLEHGRDEGSREGHTENGRPAQQGAIAGGESIDACRDESLDCVRHLLGRLPCLIRRGKLLEKQRVAGSALHERGQILVSQAPVARRCPHERPRVVRGKRLEPQGESG